ncbi:MAG: pyridoxamine 5'-phosphate oxidase family protein [Phycisphaerae bacterium]|nr:pyridoxamine 5'-phosphate oxidase family protein [Phycisphaerae bacterium]
MTEPAQGRNESISPSDRATVRRMPSRGIYDRAAINAILDEAVVCHVGFIDEGQPFVIPSIHVRIGDRLYMHGSPGSRMLRRVAEGEPICVTVTLVDGLVLARSAFHHSMNYRSVMVFASASEVIDPGEKRRAFHALVEHIVPGRMSETRPPNERELAGTMVVSMPITEASAKTRVGPPKDDEADQELPVWAGVIPLSLRSGAPIPCPRLRGGVMPPDYAVNYSRPSPPKF